MSGESRVRQILGRLRKKMKRHEMLRTLPRSVSRFLLVCVALELCALLSEIAGFGSTVRRFLIVWGGFWPGLLSGDDGMYPGQQVLMFASSAVVHGGPLHLLMNMLGLVWLGPLIVRRAGPRAFWPIAGLSALGSGFGYALLSSGNTPMVGASGVLFGFLGAVAVWAVLDRLARKQSLLPIIQNALVLVFLNVALMVLSPASVAWQAHLGGLLAGAIAGAMTWHGGRRFGLG